MKISQKRIRTPQNYLLGIPTDESFYVALTSLGTHAQRLNRIGFNPNVAIGQQMLPNVIGKVTRFNADGGYVRQKHLPKVTIYREAEIKDWHGNLHTVYIPMLIYPRLILDAPNIELLVRSSADGVTPIITSPQLINNGTNMDLIKHIINLFLEIFGECEILQQNLLPAFNVPVTRLNWNILPSGSYPWSVLQTSVQGIINRTNPQRQRIIERRIRRIASFSPDFVAVGQAGFHGYIVFGFSRINVFILESIYTGNATYVLGQNWQQISQLTKEEILSQNLHQQRIVHYQNWEREIDTLLQ